MDVKGLLQRLLVAALATLLVVGAGELVLRLAGGSGGVFVDTRVATHTHTPGRGPDWRGAERPGPKAPGSFRIVAIGDSFAWGAGVHAEDVYPRRLERRLAELDSEWEFEVVNWSRPGWNTLQEWESAERRLASVAPDLVILGFTLNDAEPTGTRVRKELYQPLLRRAPAAAASRGLYRVSALYRLFWERFENRRQRRAFTAYYQGLFEGESWQRCRAALARFRAATRELSTPLLLVVFPVFDSQLDESYAYHAQHRKVAAAAHKFEIPVLDLLSTYRGIDARRLAVTPFTDPHPNELAHRIASDQLAIHLVTEGLVPAAFPPGMRKTPTAVRKTERPPKRRRPTRGRSVEQLEDRQ